MVHIQDALNGKEVDWPGLFYGYIKAELITLKEELYKDKTTNLRTVVGPPLTMFFISEGYSLFLKKLRQGYLFLQKLSLHLVRKKENVNQIAKGNHRNLQTCKF